ncbi:MAG: hypothetical protein HRU38_19615, partial [Saccharospirillaceae bacterium]|nr:hypothetical protein [Pseudomonadales bacterium]NRB80845.1 hypothetical protein [Saccharospirillaceae bacterium]
MQQMLGVSFLSTHANLPAQTDKNSVVDSTKDSSDAGLNDSKIDFNQIFNQQVSSNKKNENNKEESVDIGETSLSNGDNLPDKLSEIGKMLSNFETLDQLKMEFESQGLSTKFFTIELNSQNNIEIQSTDEADLQNASIQKYSSILVMQIGKESDPQLAFEQIASQLLNGDDTQLNDQKTLTNSSEIMQWLRVNIGENQLAIQGSKDLMQQILGEDLSTVETISFDINNKDMSFDPELKMLNQSELANMLTKGGAISSDYENENVALVVISELENPVAIDDRLLDEVVPVHVSAQLIAQTTLMARSTTTNNVVLADSEFTSDFLNTKNVNKDESKINVINNQINDKTLEGEEHSQYEELDLDSNDLDLDEPVKTKRTLQSELAAQSEKTLSTKPGQIELPAIN